MNIGNPVDEELTDFGLPIGYDGMAEPRHIFFIRDGADISELNWPEMGSEGGLEWAIQPLISRKEAQRRGNQQASIQ